MASIRVVLDSHHEDDTAEIFIGALHFHLKAAMPYHDFNIVCRETEKLCEVGAEVIAASNRALAEYRDAGAHECIHITPLELIGEIGDTVVFVVVRVGSVGMRYLNMLTFSTTHISRELSAALRQHVLYARTRYMGTRTSDDSSAYVQAVTDAYMVASTMVERTSDGSHDEIPAS